MSDRAPTRLHMPELKAPFTAEDVILWLGDCEDAIEAFGDLKRSDETLTVVQQISEAGMKIQGEGKIWWNQHREELKALTTWDAFAAEVRELFLDSGFVLTAEHDFYRTRQGSDSFTTYAAKLATRRATLGIGKDRGKFINNDQFKRHLLHHANDLLYARTTSTAGFTLSTFTVNSLIGHMTAVASLLGLEWKGQVSVTNFHITRLPRDLKSNMARHTPLTAEARQQCIDEGRCFNCREMGHSICECPKTTGGTIGDHPDQLNFMGDQAYRQPWGSDSSDSELDEAFENEWLGGSEKEEEDEEAKK